MNFACKAAFSRNECRTGTPARRDPGRAGVFVLRVLWAALALGTATSARAQSVWEFTPYKVQVLTAFGAAPEFSPSFKADLTADLLARIETLIGAAWETAVEPAPSALRQEMLAHLDAVAVDRLPPGSLKFDKVMLLAIVPAASDYRIAARELDVRTRLFGATIRLPVAQLAKLRDGAFRALRAAFAPLARVETVEPKSVTLRLRAAALPPRDPSCAPLRTGDIMQPLLRFSDREGNARRVSVIPWTLLTVLEVKEAEVKCRLDTGLRSPLSGRRRGRVEQLALLVIPPHKPSTLKLLSRTETDQPLAGYEVHLQSADGKGAELLGRTDRQGKLTIQPADRAILTLLVKHGGQLLARLPLVPGVREEVVANLANDDPRLEAEEVITQFQEMLVDLVTRREILTAKARAGIAAQRFDQVEKLISDLHLLDTREDLARTLSQHQRRIVSKDPSVQKKIDALFGDTHKLLDKHLDPELIERLRRELSARRGAAAKTGT